MFGARKLFGPFRGSLGFRPGRPMAAVAGASEAGAGMLLVLGLLTPLASAAVIGTLVVAGSIHWAAGLWGQNSGYEMRCLSRPEALRLVRRGRSGRRPVRADCRPTPCPRARGRR